MPNPQTLLTSLVGRATPASLRRPGFMMGITAVLDLVVTLQLGGSVAAALPRLALGGATSVLSLVTGSRGGRPRSVCGMLGAPPLWSRRASSSGRSPARPALGCLRSPS